jgi:arylsulfatase
VDRSLRALCLALALTTALACSPEESEPLTLRNLIVINIDSLRADRLGCYGSPRETSPFLDALCGDAVVFERATSASSYTRESVAALFTGRLPSKSGALGWHAQPVGPEATLAERLRKHGFRTGLLSNSVMLRLPGFARGFERTQHLPRRWDLSGEGPRLSETALAFTDGVGGERFFLYLHYLDPHAPYEPVARFRARSPPAPVDGALSLYDDAIPQLAALRREGFGPGEERFDDLAARYEAEVRATDAALAALFRGLEERSLLADTLIVVTADHGEEFLEHGYLEHGWTLYDEVLRVPLLFFAPSVLAPGRVAAGASQIDLFPSVLALLGLPAGDAALDGASLFVSDRRGFRPAEQERIRFAELLLPRRQVLRAVLEGDWKYIATQRELEPAQRPRALERRRRPPPTLYGPPIREELYRLSDDPGETRNRVLSDPDVRRRLSDALERLGASGPNFDFAPASAEEAPAVSDEEIERLRALGYHP